jgi:predicted MFS family arabinose efflux permease
MAAKRRIRRKARMVRENILDNSQAGSAAAEWRASWTLVIAAMIGYSVASIPAGSTGVMMAPIEQELGWSRTEIYSGVSLISFIAFFTATFLGAAIDRIGPKLIAIAAILFFCVGIGFLSLVDGSLWQWWAAWAFIGLGAAAMPTVWLSPIPGRFSVSRGLAVAVVLSGSGLSTFLVPIVSHALVESYGWRGAYLGLAAIWGAVSLPLVALFFGGKPAPRKAEAAAPAKAVLPGLTAREGFRSGAYWLLLFGSFCGIFGGVALVMNLVPVLVSTGIEKGSAAAIAGLVGIATITGRVVGGWLMDRMSAKAIAAMASAMAGTLPATLILFPGSATAATIAIIVYGAFGGAKIGAINASVALAVALAPLGANVIYDLTQSYAIVMWAALPMLLLAGALYLMLPAYPDFTERDASGQ